MSGFYKKCNQSWAKNWAWYGKFTAEDHFDEVSRVVSKRARENKRTEKSLKEYAKKENRKTETN